MLFGKDVHVSGKACKCFGRTVKRLWEKVRFVVFPWVVPWLSPLQSGRKKETTFFTGGLPVSLRVRGIRVLIHFKCVIYGGVAALVLSPVLFLGGRDMPASLICRYPADVDPGADPGTSLAKEIRLTQEILFEPLNSLLHSALCLAVMSLHVSVREAEFI